MKPLRKFLPALAGILIMGAATVSQAQIAKMSKGIAQFGTASKELVSLYNQTKDTKSAQAAAKKVAAAQKRKAAAEAAIQAALQKLDAKNEKAGRMAEKLFGQMQKHNQAVAEARLASIERIAAAEAKSRKKK